MSFCHWKESPKSISIILSFFSFGNKKFSAFRSLWQIFCKWRYFIVLTIWVNIFLVIYSENTPYKSILSKSYPPLHRLNKNNFTPQQDRDNSHLHMFHIIWQHEDDRAFEGYPPRSSEPLDFLSVFSLLLSHTGLSKAAALTWLGKLFHSHHGQSAL